MLEKATHRIKRSARPSAREKQVIALRPDDEFFRAERIQRHIVENARRRFASPDENRACRRCRAGLNREIRSGDLLECGSQFVRRRPLRRCRHRINHNGKLSPPLVGQPQFRAASRCHTKPERTSNDGPYSLQHCGNVGSPLEVTIRLFHGRRLLSHTIYSRKNIPQRAPNSDQAPSRTSPAARWTCAVMLPLAVLIKPRLAHALRRLV